MTTALCFNCGETKLGAWCPCGKCGVETCGNRELDIIFSDHKMTVATLEKFGDLIKQLARVSSDPGVRFWAFISYVSHHPSELLSATPPEEIADQVQRVLVEAQLPIIDVELKPLPRDTGPPKKTIPFPEALFQRFTTATSFLGIEAVQVRQKDGVVISGELWALDGPPELLINADIEIAPDEIVAVRSMPGSLIGWLIKPRWIESS